jgi:hypothetical protein
MSMYYGLRKDGTTYKIGDGEFLEWAASFSKSDRKIGSTFLTSPEGDEIRVSTVFLGIDHNVMGTIPILFETMIFGGKHDGDYQERCATYKEALVMHRKAVQMLVSEGCTDPNEGPLEFMRNLKEL